MPSRARRHGRFLAMVSIRPLEAAALAVALFLVPAGAEAGHEVSYYPSFYPQEIRIESLSPEVAAKEFAANKLHAYIGASPRFGAPAPAYLKSTVSLHSLITVRVNPRSVHAQGRDTRCQAFRHASKMLATRPDIVAHAYPITPYHADYFDHADLVAQSGRTNPSASGETLPLTARAQDPNDETLLRPEVRTHLDDWDVEFAETSTAELTRMAGAGFSIWPAAPSAKEGWVQAYHLLRASIGEPAARDRADAIFGRLTRDAFKDDVEKLDLERGLIAALTQGCERSVIGYRTRAEYYNDDSSNGIENMAVDSQSGFNSPAFVRTVKLKDFPWNGWLRLGVVTTPKAAWNPVAGFSDALGRLVWATLGDDAYLPIPYNSRFVDNRVQIHTGIDPRLKQSARAPAEVMLPELGTGFLHQVVPSKSATTKLTYRVLASPFHDGSELEPADLLYPYALAFRWGGEDIAGSAFDPDVAQATRTMRERLKGVHVVRIEESTFNIADIAITTRIPIVDVYLEGRSAAEPKGMMLAPPWSTVPWHVLALMEAAVERGIGAFSRREAERRRVPWLDLVRDPEQRLKMLALAGEFAKAGYRPKTLETLVSPQAATARWRALEKFAALNGHLLVTNAGYRLANWSPGAAVFEMVRDPGFPIGLGTFDNLSDPPRALITGLEHVANRIVIAADVEFTVKEHRNRRIVRMPLKSDTLRGTLPIRRLVRYLMVDDQDRVAAAGSAKPQADGKFTVALPSTLPPEPYMLSVAVFLDGNTINPQISRYSFRNN